MLQQVWLCDLIALSLAGLGVLATTFFFWPYYRKGGNELRREAGELRRITKLILVGLQDAGLVRVNWDKDGRPTGVNVTIRLSSPEVRLSAPGANVVTTEPAKRANDGD
jgi:hypothetical protein